MRNYFSYFLHEKYHSITVKKKKCDHVTLHGFFTWGFWHFTTNVISKWNIVWKDNMIHKHFLCSSHAFLMQNFKLHVHVNLAKIATSSQSIFARHLHTVLLSFENDTLKLPENRRPWCNRLITFIWWRRCWNIISEKKRFNRWFPVTT